MCRIDQYPIAAKSGSGDTRGMPDQVTAKLAALHFYQLAIPAPKPPEGSFDKEAARRGKTIFNSKAKCASCHVPPLFTEPGNNLHAPSEIGVDSFQADRSPTHMYRTAPLAGLRSHQKGGFYHDGRFAALRDVVEHYDNFSKLKLAEREKIDLIEYLKSLQCLSKPESADHSRCGREYGVGASWFFRASPINEETLSKPTASPPCATSHAAAAVHPKCEGVHKRTDGPFRRVYHVVVKPSGSQTEWLGHSLAG